MRRHAIHLIYAAGFVLAFSLALTAYVTSTFISNLIGSNYVGIIYSIAAVITLVSFFIYPKIIRKYGEKKIILSSVAINILSLVILTFLKNKAILVITALVYISTQSILIYLFDLLVEHFTKQNNVGHSRGKYLSITNIAWVITPFIAGNLMSLYGIKALFAISSIAVFVVYLMLHKELELEKPLAVNKIKIEALPKKNRRNIILVITANFFLQFFFTWMIIYSPIYLHDNLGVAWTSIGLIFTIMLIPFVILPYPLGVFVDKHGERIIMSFGFIITALATLWFANNTSSSFVVLALILFFTRVGASIIEIMSETYFFKLVTEADTGVISLFRNMRSLSYIIGPLSATLVISFLNIKSLFSILAIIMIFSSLCAFLLTEKPRVTIKKTR